MPLYTDYTKELEEKNLLPPDINEPLEPEEPIAEEIEPTVPGRPAFKETWTHQIPVYGTLKKNLDLATLGISDTAFGIAKWFPWTRPAGEWWDKNNPETKTGLDTAVRNISGVVIPSVLGGGWAVSGVKGLAGPTAAKLPWLTKFAGEAALRLGIDTTVVAGSSTARDDNVAQMMNEAWGWGIPWGTRPNDSPDARLVKNLGENAGFAVFGEVLSLALAGKQTPTLFKAKGPKGANKLQNKPPDPWETPTLNVEPEAKDIAKTRLARNAEIANETRFRKDVDGYDAFKNNTDAIPAEPQKIAVQNIGPDPWEAAVDEFAIQNNIGTTNGRARPWAPTKIMRKLANALKGSQRGKILDDFHATLPEEVSAIRGNLKMSPNDFTKTIDNIVQQIYTFSPKEMSRHLEQIKTITRADEGIKLLGDKDQALYTVAFNKVFKEALDVNKLRASSVLTQQAAGNVVDASRAMNAIEDVLDTTRQQELLLQNLKLINKEVRINRFIWGRTGRNVLQLKGLKEGVSPEALAEATQTFINEAGSIDNAIKEIVQKNDDFYDLLDTVRVQKPEFLKPLGDVHAKTNGKVDTIEKLNRFIEESFDFSKAIYDRNPSIPNIVLQGLHGVRLNNLLSGLAPVRALAGNTIMTAIKPVSILAGAKLTGNDAVLKRALYMYSGVYESTMRAFSMAGDEWRYAVANPQEAIKRNRFDYRKARMDQLDVIEGMQEVWKKEAAEGVKGAKGKLALTNIAKVTSWFNNNKYAGWGVNAMQSIDGMTNSFLASASARGKAYDILLEKRGGAILDTKEFTEELDVLQKQLYSEAFDETGLLTDKAVKYAAGEIKLNLDNDVVSNLENLMNTVPALKSIFLFPRTGANALNLTSSFIPGSNKLPWLKANRVFNAVGPEKIQEALLEHGIDVVESQRLMAFEALKSEYIGRQLMGSAVVMFSGLLAANGLITGNGTQDPAENLRLTRMGWKPMTLFNPLNPEQSISLKNLPVFGQLIGLTADMVMHANRADSAFFDEGFQKLAMSIGLNITNETFLSGFEPLLKLGSDPTAWSRLNASLVDSMIPGTGARSVLNNALSSPLKDVKNDFFYGLANKNKWLVGGLLEDHLDIYTGEPIRSYNPIIAGVNSVLPFFKSNGGMEPWRQWLVATGWDGLPIQRTHPDTGRPLEPKVRQFINNYIAEEGILLKEIQRLYKKDKNTNFVKEQLEDYKQGLGLGRSQQEWPIKQIPIHRTLTELHNQAVKRAWTVWSQNNQHEVRIDGLRKVQKNQMRSGDIQGARDTRNEIDKLLQFTK